MTCYNNVNETRYGDKVKEEKETRTYEEVKSIGGKNKINK